MTTLNRRQVFGLGAGVFATLTWGAVLPAQAANDSGDLIKAFTAGKTPPWPGVVHSCYRDSRSQTAVVTAMLTAHRLRRTWWA